MPAVIYYSGDVEFLRKNGKEDSIAFIPIFLGPDAKDGELVCFLRIREGESLPAFESRASEFAVQMDCRAQAQEELAAIEKARTDL
jgi:hypothetical protein